GDARRTGLITDAEPPYERGEPAAVGPRGGRANRGFGFNAYAIRTSTAPWFDVGLEIRRTGRRYTLATTQPHHTLEGRNLLRAATLAEFQANPNFAHEEEGLIEEGEPQSNRGILSPP